MRDKYIIFDLDDTLINELDYLKSAYKEIAFKILPIGHEELYSEMIEWYTNGLNTFDLILERFQHLDIQQLTSWYRLHIPTISLKEGALDLLHAIKKCDYGLGIITDGRSFTQRNKIKAVCIEKLFDKIVISEEIGSTKPSIKNYECFNQTHILEYFYVGDNVSKDFISAKNLGWKTICLKDSGTNIHRQNFNLSREYLPDYIVEKLVEIKEIIDCNC